MRAHEFITEGYKEVTQKYITSGADPSKVKTAIDQYKELVKRNQVAGDERNIDWWGKNKSFADLEKFISSKDLNRTKTQLKRNKIQGEVVTLRDDDEWTIVIPLDKDTSCNYGSNTDWCTAKRERDYYEDYVAKGVVLIYCINNQTKKKWAIATSFVVKNSSEFFDQHDTSLTSQQFATQTGLNPTQLISQASKYNTQIEKARQNVKYKDKLTNPKTAYEYAENVIKGRWTEGEAVIASNPKYAYYYAKNVIKGRWHEGEAVIASDPCYAYKYARDFIKGRWPKGEAAIASDPKYANEYANFLKKMKITEDSELPNGHKSATPHMKKHLKLDNSNPYAPWRFSAHFLAGADGKNPYEFDPESSGPSGQALVTVGYTDVDRAMIKQAEKAFGSEATATELTPMGSKETQDTNTKSIVRKVKKY